MVIFIEIKWSTDGQLMGGIWNRSKSNFKGIQESKQNLKAQKRLDKIWQMTYSKKEQYVIEKTERDLG